ncbi:MAG: class I SAM-dependent methyltransferase [Enhydrobacter sp.]|nr:class I SAM-dependent methyltransferase [Enhydrobacter sp.]
MENFDGYDFMDFGASKGGSLRWASKIFGGKGIGVDISQKKIDQLRASGGEAFLGDVTKLNLPVGTFRYATMIDFLEHLPNRATGLSALGQAISASRDFVFVKGPNFDDLDYLHGLGLKKYFADWHGHKWHHTVAEFDDYLKGTGLRYCIVESDRMTDSSNPKLLPLAAARDRGPYDPATDLPKPHCKFRKPIYSVLTVIVAIAPTADLTELFAQSQRMRVRVAGGKA